MQGTPKTLENLDDVIEAFKKTSFHSDKWVKTDADKKEVSETMKQFFKENDFGMMIDSKNLDSVLESGFKNQFETFSSGGSLVSHSLETIQRMEEEGIKVDWSTYKIVEKDGKKFAIKVGKDGQIHENDSRLRMSHKLFIGNMPLEEDRSSLVSASYKGEQLPRNAYEKYGMVLDRDKRTSIKDAPDFYGDVQVRFKKRNIENRTTWTAGDSLNGLTSNSILQPSRVTNPSYVSFKKTMTKKPHK